MMSGLLLHTSPCPHETNAHRPARAVCFGGCWRLCFCLTRKVIAVGWGGGVSWTGQGVSWLSHVCGTFYFQQPRLTVNLFLFSRIMGWRQRTWRPSPTSSMRRLRTCRTSSRGGDAAATTTAEPLASCPMTSSPPWWTWSLQPRASSPGWTGEICKMLQPAPKKPCDNSVQCIHKWIWKRHLKGWLSKPVLYLQNDNVSLLSLQLRRSRLTSPGSAGAAVQTHWL